MRVGIRQAGQTLAIDSRLAWVDKLVREAAGDHLEAHDKGAALVHLLIDDSTDPFNVHDWDIVTRDAFSRAGSVVLRNVATSGFDLLVTPDSDVLSVTARWRPPFRDRGAARLMPTRFHLLVRAVLLQYPVMWWVGRTGYAPLHAPVCGIDGRDVLLAGPAGVGKSTLILEELTAGSRAISDNLSVGDGTNAYGVVEPARVIGGTCRRMPHDRRELFVRWVTEPVVPDLVAVMRRVIGEGGTWRSLDSAAAARALVAGTYMAGELRRYWSFAATLASGTGLGPAAPTVSEVASAFCRRLPCVEVAVGSNRPVPLRVLLKGGATSMDSTGHARAVTP
jgi:hypothetical protein